jgi:hypothetical protein
MQAAALAQRGLGGEPALAGAASPPPRRRLHLHPLRPQHHSRRPCPPLLAILTSISTLAQRTQAK